MEYLLLVVTFCTMADCSDHKYNHNRIEQTNEVFIDQPYSVGLEASLIELGVEYDVLSINDIIPVGLMP